MHGKRSDAFEEADMAQLAIGEYSYQDRQDYRVHEQTSVRPAENGGGTQRRPMSRPGEISERLEDDVDRRVGGFARIKLNDMMQLRVACSAYRRLSVWATQCRSMLASVRMS